LFVGQKEILKCLSLYFIIESHTKKTNSTKPAGRSKGFSYLSMNLSRGHRAQGTGHGAQGEERRAQGAEHRAQGAERREESVERRTKERESERAREQATDTEYRLLNTYYNYKPE
jgi:hypothetical protein